MQDFVLLLSQQHLFEKTLILERNQYLKMAGETDTNIYFVEEGSLKLFVLDDVEEQIIRFGYEQDMVAALDSFLSGRPSPFYIQAIRKTKVRVIKQKNFLQFMNSEPSYLRMWIAILEDLILQQLEREQDLLISSPKQRYNRVLERSPRLFQEIPHKYIANYLRMTPETLSRLKKS